jgi:hypothetical protein
MKYPFRANIIVLIFALLVACGQVSQLSPTSSATPFPSDTPIPSQTMTPQIEASPTVDINALPTFSFINTPVAGVNIPSPTANPNIPTLLPTIDPISLPELLRKAISVQALKGVNGHNIQQITGWDYGLSQSNICNTYQWLDPNHLLLYPRTGQEMVSAFGSMVQKNLSSQLIVVNLINGSFWSSPIESASRTTLLEQNCSPVYWSQELGIIIIQKLYGNLYSDIQKEAVFTYTFDGQEISHYWGKILSVSPSGTKILVDEDTLIDLRNNKITDLGWYMDYDLERSPNLYWSSDEARLYRCCFYFADLKTGKSYSFKWSDLRGVNGKPVSSPVIPHTHGQWVRNDNFFLVKWDYFSDYSADYIPMFSPVEKKYYDLAEMTGIPVSLVYYATFAVSPDGMYVWITGADPTDGTGMRHGFLVNLVDFKTVSYDNSGDNFDWSPDSKFVWVTISNTSGSTNEIYILSVIENTLTLFPTDRTTIPAWHPSKHILAYLTKQNQTISILDAKDMSVEEWKLPLSFDNLIWSPDGSHIALIATDGSLWQANYPKMENIEQLTKPMPMGNIQWAPDSTSISFTSGKDIYVVKTTK